MCLDLNFVSWSLNSLGSSEHSVNVSLWDLSKHQRLLRQMFHMLIANLTYKYKQGVICEQTRGGMF